MYCIPPVCVNAFRGAKACAWILLSSGGAEKCLKLGKSLSSLLIRSWPLNASLEAPVLGGSRAWLWDTFQYQGG